MTDPRVDASGPINGASRLMRSQDGVKRLLQFLRIDLELLGNLPQDVE